MEMEEVGWSNGGVRHRRGWHTNSSSFLAQVLRAGQALSCHPANCLGSNVAKESSTLAMTRSSNTGSPIFHFGFTKAETFADLQFRCTKGETPDNVCFCFNL